MANPEHLEILKQGVEQWNKWKKEHPEVEPDLSRVNLREAKLHGVDLRAAKLDKTNLDRANLSGADLSEADLSLADLVEADLSGADLSDADLGLANLSKADLRRADLSGADLRFAYLLRANLGQANLSGADLGFADLGGANLGQANLRQANLPRADLWAANLGGTDFTEAHAWATIFANVDLSAAKGLETVIHEGPSTIGIDAIYKSHGKIPEAFLRGCGVPDNLIKYMHSLTGQAFEFRHRLASGEMRDVEVYSTCLAVENLWLAARAEGLGVGWGKHYSR